MKLVMGMNPESLKKAEDEYRRLTGLYEDGIMDKKNYSRALKKLALLDVQGNYWMIGADSGNWYRYQKGKWLKGNPHRQMVPVKSAGIKSAPAHLFSILSLVFANLMPLGGVLFFNWTVSTVIFLFWMENLVIGGWNIIKMKKARGTQIHTRFSMNNVPAERVSRKQIIGFFLMHYGGFTLGHFIFVLALFRFPEGGWGWLGLSFLFLCGSHGVSYFKNFIDGGEYLSTSYQDLFFRPYGRIIVLHIVIVAGGAFIMKNKGIVPLMMLVGGKIIIDLIGHLLERKKLIGQPDKSQIP
jgi:hypothetical protein